MFEEKSGSCWWSVSWLDQKIKDRQEHAQSHPSCYQNIVFTVHADQVDFASLLCFDVEYRHRNSVENTVRMKVGSTSFVNVVPTSENDVVPTLSIDVKTTSKTRCGESWLNIIFRHCADVG